MPPIRLLRRPVLRLKSNLSLYLEQGATSSSATSAAFYDQAEPGASNSHQDSGHSHWHDGLLWS